MINCDVTVVPFWSIVMWQLYVVINCDVTVALLWSTVIWQLLHYILLWCDSVIAAETCYNNYTDHRDQIALSCFDKMQKSMRIKQMNYRYYFKTYFVDFFKTFKYKQLRQPKELLNVLFKCLYVYISNFKFWTNSAVLKVPSESWHWKKTAHVFY